MIGLERIRVLFRGERPLRFSFDEHILRKVRHLFQPVALVELNRILEGTNLRVRAAGKILLKIGFQLIQQDGEFGIIELSMGRQVGRINDDCALLFHFVDQRIHHVVHGIAEAEIFARDSDPRAL